jgi:hypothetical protein
MALMIYLTNVAFSVYISFIKVSFSPGSISGGSRNFEKGGRPRERAHPSKIAKNSLVLRSTNIR